MSDNPFDPNQFADEQEGLFDEATAGATETPQFGFASEYGQQPRPFGVPYGFPYPSEPTGPSYNFLTVWRKAVVLPKLATYQDLLRDRYATIDRAYLWLVSTIFLGSLGIITASVVSEAGSDYSGNDNLGFYIRFNTSSTSDVTVTQLLIISLICGLPLLIIFGTVGLTIIIGVIHVLARILGGQVQFDKMAYAISAYMSPVILTIAAFNLLLSPLSFLDSVLVSIFASLISITFWGVLFLYTIYVITIAVKAAHNIGWGESFIAAVSPLGLVCVCCFACVFLTLTPFFFVMGP